MSLKCPDWASVRPISRPGGQAGGYHHLLHGHHRRSEPGRHPRLFYACLAEVVPYIEIAIPTVQDKVQGGKLTDERSLARASGLVIALALAASR